MKLSVAKVRDIKNFKLYILPLLYPKERLNRRSYWCLITFDQKETKRIIQNIFLGIYETSGIFFRVSPCFCILCVIILDSFLFLKSSPPTFLVFIVEKRTFAQLSRNREAIEFHFFFIFSIRHYNN